MFYRAVVLLTKFKWKFALVYLVESVEIFLTPDKRIAHVRQVLMLLQDAAVTLQRKKCEVFTNGTENLGHIIRPGCIEVSTRTIDAIRGLKYRSRVKERQWFLGLSNVIRLFVTNSACVAAPLR